MKRAIERYFSQSQDIFNSVLLVLPLFVFYQLGLLFTGGIRNGADFVTLLLLSLVGGDVGLYTALNVSVFGLFIICVWVLAERNDFTLRLWPWMLLESFVYALFFGSAVITTIQWLQLDAILAAGTFADMNWFQQMVMSAGAGIYEELVFRFALLGGLFWVGDKLFDWPTWMAAVSAVAVSSLMFSGIHHVGSLGEVFALRPFVFRTIAGVLLAVIFYFRGFAIAVYTHAFYDMIVFTMS
jgi:hypothetical protein